MNKPDFPDWSFNLIVKIGGLCSIVTLAGIVVSAGSYVTWLASMPFMSERQSEPIHEFANKTVLATLPFLGVSIAGAATASFVLDREWERRKTQQDLDAIERIRQSVEQINAHEIELSGIRPTLEEISAQQTRLSERLTEIAQQLSTYSTESSTDFYAPETPLTNTESDRADCRYFNSGSHQFYLRCSEHPHRTNCIDCSAYNPSN